MKVLIESNEHEKVYRSYRINFDWTDKNGRVIEANSGFSFDCDELGNIDSNTSALGKENYAKCLTGSVDGKPVSQGNIEWSEKIIRLCSCGSGEIPTDEYDGHGIFLCHVCPKCRKEKLSKYRQDIFEPYTCDEAIEES
jgi:hypothetical protein